MTHVTHPVQQEIPPQRSVLVRIAVILILICIAGVSYWALAVEELRSPTALLNWLESAVTLENLSWPARIMLLFCMAVGGLVCLMPSPIVIAALGLALGAGVGLAVALAAIAAAVAIERLLAATVVGDALHSRLAAKHPNVDQTVEQYGLPGVLLLRAIGVPTTVLAWASSATSLAWWKVSLGASLGTLPRGFAYATLGAAGASLLQPEEWTWQVWVSAGLLAALLVVSAILGWRGARQVRNTHE
jgi:uncharacterized membrane protein YdjX (TVP38/TMEM64 family)